MSRSSGMHQTARASTRRHETLDVEQRAKQWQCYCWGGRSALSAALCWPRATILLQPRTSLQTRTTRYGSIQIPACIGIVTKNGNTETSSLPAIALRWDRCIQGLTMKCGPIRPPLTCSGGVVLSAELPGASCLRVKRRGQLRTEANPRRRTSPVHFRDVPSCVRRETPTPGALVSASARNAQILPVRSTGTARAAQPLSTSKVETANAAQT
ncbi:hypothetical protein HG15A2_27680 [Adhaeretor mobilis]|uniref:Uncharacterized protein n=1 Tax=Adhaeretor mobilis TaxID=1930276 RepID=A0A517MX35_9BACT|nr:hypothetical protein HG15A2_27680 [Adhaeretor mobilis]